LAQLLKLGMNCAQDGEGAQAEALPDEVLAELLSNRLLLVDEKGKPGRKPGHRADRSLREVLMDPETSVSALKQLKDYGKAFGQASDSKAEQAAGAAVYYAAIAAALVFHEAKITAYAYPHLCENLAKLKESNWAPLRLKTLFGKAIDICERRMKEAPAEEVE